MKKTIKKNNRRPFPYFNICIPVILTKNRNYTLTRHFKFTDSCLYQLYNEDQFDINKLFGFSIGLHHTESYRFGWRPNLNLTKIEIFKYEYHNKIMSYEKICNVEINKWYQYDLKYNKDTKQIEYSVTNHVTKTQYKYTPITFNRIKFGYQLFLYFGGNQRAPEDIIIYKSYT